MYSLYLYLMNMSEDKSRDFIFRRSIQVSTFPHIVFSADSWTLVLIPCFDWQWIPVEDLTCPTKWTGFKTGRICKSIYENERKRQTKHREQMARLKSKSKLIFKLLKNWNFVGFQVFIMKFQIFRMFSLF